MMDDVASGKPICNLREHIKKLFQKTKCGIYGENGFDMEFTAIEKKTERDLYYGDYRSALKACNREKNRYSNVLPLEKSRVVLSHTEGVEGSDYINASFVRGETSGSETYICTQGPLQNTFDDFWRMVWEQNSNIIVMLTKEVENLKVKCARYWPDEGAQVYGNFRVTLLSEENTAELLIRTFTLEDVDSNIPARTVLHYQYVSWPDHGLPVSTTAFLELVRTVDKQRRTGPIVVHCSAGIGRSGTFCTVHHVITKFRNDIKTESTPEFNIMQTVIYMRGQRPGMVQTKEQYMFCCLSIEEETSYVGKRLHVNPKALNYSQ